MKFNMRMIYICIEFFLIISATFSAISDDKIIEGANDRTYGKLQVSVTNGLVSIESTEASLQEIMEKIAKLTNIQIYGTIESKKPVSMSIDHLTVEEVVRQLVNNAIIVYHEESNHSVPEISKIIILSASTGISSLPNQIPMNNPETDTILESGQQLIDTYGPPPIPLPPSLPPPSDQIYQTNSY